MLKINKERKYGKTVADSGACGCCQDLRVNLRILLKFTEHVQITQSIKLGQTFMTFKCKRFYALQ